MQPPAPESNGIGVTELLNVLVGSGLRLASAQIDLRLPLTPPTLFDPWTPPKGHRGGILLGIGLHPEAPESASVIRDAARSGFGSVVVKSLGLSVETLTAVADIEGIALLVVDDEIEWRQLDALISSALVSATEANGSLSAPAVGDLFALANAIAAMVGGATAIEDMQERVLAYSTLPGQAIDEERQEGILGRQVPALPGNVEQYAAVFRSPTAVRIQSLTSNLGRLAVAVRAGAQPLGSIWVVDAHNDLDDHAEQALEHAAEIAALHMLRARSAADLARQQQTELMRRALEGGEDARLVVEQLNLDTSGPFIVLAFQPEFEPTGDELRMARLIDLIAMQCEIHQHGSECVLIGDTIYALFAGSVAVEIDSAEALALRVVGRAKAALGAEIRAAIGSVVSTTGQIRRSRHDADLVLLLLANQPTPTSVASAHEVRSRLMLLELAKILRDKPRLFSRQARRVLDFDAKSGTDYAKTIRTYLDCARDTVTTAARLSLHQNTLRYRLRRASELFDIDLANPDDTLALWLSLRAIEFD